MTSRPNNGEQGPPPEGGHAAERLRQFEAARGRRSPAEPEETAHDDEAEGEPAASEQPGQEQEGDEDSGTGG
jgi:hypothetical protein